MNRDIKKIVLSLIKKYNTQNPFRLADSLKNRIYYWFHGEMQRMLFIS